MHDKFQLNTIQRLAETNFLITPVALLLVLQLNTIQRLTETRRLHCVVSVVMVPIKHYPTIN